MAHRHHYNVSTLPFIEWVEFSTESDAISYAFQDAYKSLLYMHILLMMLATLVLLPAAVMLRKSRWHNTMWTATSVFGAVGALVARRHGTLTKDLYIGAVHRRFGVLVLGAILLNTIYAYWSSWKVGSKRNEETQFQLVSSQDEVEGEIDSARSSETLYRRRNGTPDSRDHSVEDTDKRSYDVPSRLDRLKALLGPCRAATLLVLSYVQILLGIATYLHLFADHEIFNGLAHWIKASVFLLFGVWVLMRYFGYGASMGHSWNTTRHGAKSVSPETIESALIFTYGSVDLFLERLGHGDEPISHTDIQHMSIAMMFASAGLVGLMIESRVIRRLLLRGHRDLLNEEEGGEEEYKAQESADNKTFNVMPSLVVFFTGLLMSQHSQDFIFATQLHATWGYYFCIAAMLRITTYCLLYVRKAPISHRPSHPPTEILVSFCLIAGAIVFMLSSRDTAQGLAYYGIDLMFVISLSVAGALSIMVWTLYLMVLRSLGM